MDKEFLVKLRASLETLDARISSLEHIVNDTIIGGLKQAAEEYEDDERFSNFCDTYSGEYEGLIEPASILYGSDYDLPSALYEEVKVSPGYGEDGFDEKAAVSSLLQEIRDKIEALKSIETKVEEKVDESEKEAVPDSDEEDIPSDEQLAREFEEYNHE